MKLTKLAAALSVAAAVLVFLMDVNAFAFHDGGVANCEGCHTMHNSYAGVKMTVTGTVNMGNAYLLIGSDPSSTCLNCHNAADTAPTEYHISTDESKLSPGVPPVERTPGGDFAWLKKSYTWVNSDDGTTWTSPGERHGHNIVAADFNYVADSTQQFAPGGGYDSGEDPYPSSKLSCISCHDPHSDWRISGATFTMTKGGLPISGSGSYGDLPTSTTSVGVYRLLGGIGYKPAYMGSANVAFLNKPFYAVAPTDYNRSEATSSVRVAYGKGSAEWCSNCHYEMHSPNGTGNEHLTGGNAIGSVVEVTNYNRYVKTADLTGTVATSYTSLVPFQIDNNTNLTILKADSVSTAGISSTDRLTCFTCHRAHASGWSSILRWNMNATFLTYGNAYGDPNSADPRCRDTACGRTQAETQAAYYDRPPSTFSLYQRVLCNKCHAKDCR